MEHPVPHIIVNVGNIRNMYQVYYVEYSISSNTSSIILIITFFKSAQSWDDLCRQSSHLYSFRNTPSRLVHEMVLKVLNRKVSLYSAVSRSISTSELHYFLLFSRSLLYSQELIVRATGSLSTTRNLKPFFCSLPSP